jgi:hypothetical protein
VNQVCKPEMPIDIAPHSPKLRTTEIAGRDGRPLASFDRLLDPKCGQLFDPRPIEQRPVFVVDYAPAFCGNQRQTRMLKIAGKYLYLLAKKSLPMVGAGAVNPLAV